MDGDIIPRGNTGSMEWMGEKEIDGKGLELMDGKIGFGDLVARVIFVS